MRVIASTITTKPVTAVPHQVPAYPESETSLQSKDFRLIEILRKKIKDAIFKSGRFLLGNMKDKKDVK